MHPALSIILFSTASGAGYGMLFWLGALSAAGLVAPERGFGLALFTLALGSVTAGLLASTFHLGRPERAWRALSQWRSSWLSREGMAALATYIPAGAFAAGFIFLNEAGGIWRIPAVLTAVGAVATVLCTGYIYRSLKPVQRWHNGWVVPNYLALAAMTGALWLAAVAAIFDSDRPPLAIIALAAIIVAAAVKLGYWRFIDRSESLATAGTATGLGGLGEVRLFEAPSTSRTYLMKEMGFQIARKHAAKLRRMALLAGFALPFLLTLLAIALPRPGEAAAALLAAILAQLGIVIERWLFFAEAKHTVTLYYGAARA